MLRLDVWWGLNGHVHVDRMVIAASAFSHGHGHVRTTGSGSDRCSMVQEATGKVPNDSL